MCKCSRLDTPERILVVLVAVTAIRISEALALQWSHIKFESGCISIEQAFRLSEITTTKTKTSKANVPMCTMLEDHLRHWRSQTPYHRDSDFVFASDKLKGKKPRSGQMVNRSYVKPAAIAAGIIREGERFGFHSLRHSLSTWVGDNLKDVKIVQELLRHAKPNLAAELYIHGIPEKNLKAQEKYVAALALQKPASDAVQ